MSDDGWVRDPDALLTIRELRGWRVGDEVEVDVQRWYAAREWRRHAFNYRDEPFGTIASFDNPESDGPVIHFPESGTWNTAHEHIIAWRPKRG